MKKPPELRLCQAELSPGVVHGAPLGLRDTKYCADCRKNGIVGRKYVDDHRERWPLRRKQLYRSRRWYESMSRKAGASLFSFPNLVQRAEELLGALCVSVLKNGKEGWPCPFPEEVEQKRGLPWAFYILGRSHHTPRTGPFDPAHTGADLSKIRLAAYLVHEAVVKRSNQTPELSVASAPGQGKELT